MSLQGRLCMMASVGQMQGIVEETVYQKGGH